MKQLTLNLLVLLLISSCALESSNKDISNYIITSGSTIRERVAAPNGYKWAEENQNSFGKFLQNIELKRDGSQVLDYRGQAIGNQSSHVGILNYDVGNKDLLQCADAVIRVRAEYLWNQKKYDQIGFHFTNGDYFSWNQYKEGYRPILISSSKVSFQQTASKDDSYSSFRKYLDVIFMYAGTISLAKETKAVISDRDIKVGDIIITPGSPGHVVFICGQAQDSKGNSIYLLAQGYTPAQSIHILTNPFDHQLNPWYEISISASSIQTARYVFLPTNIRTFR